MFRSQANYPTMRTKDEETELEALKAGSTAVKMIQEFYRAIWGDESLDPASAHKRMSVSLNFDADYNKLMEKVVDIFDVAYPGSPLATLMKFPDLSDQLKR